LVVLGCVGGSAFDGREGLSILCFHLHGRGGRVEVHLGVCLRRCGRSGEVQALILPRAGDRGGILMLLLVTVGIVGICHGHAGDICGLFFTYFFNCGTMVVVVVV